MRLLPFPVVARILKRRLPTTLWGRSLLIIVLPILIMQGAVTWAFFDMHRRVKPERRPPSISKTSTPQELETYFRRAGFAGIAQTELPTWIVTYGVKPGVS